MIRARYRLRYFLALLSLFLIAASPGAAAQSPHHAALVVDFGDGRVLARVVAFEGETISGLELLQRSGLDVALMVGLGGAAALCAVEEVGCPPTPQDCFCQCRGTPCRYWSYFHLREGAWAYAAVGMSDRRLRDGDVDGWVWGDGQSPPLPLTWEEIWARSGAASPTPPPPTAIPAPTALPSPTPPPTVSPALPAASPVVATAPPAATAAPTTPPPSPLPPAPTPPGETPPSVTPVQRDEGPADSPLPTGSTADSPAAAPGGGGIPWSLLAFVGLVVALLALAWRVRQR